MDTIEASSPSEEERRDFFLGAEFLNANSEKREKKDARSGN
jgi:hypothetical protein